MYTLEKISERLKEQFKLELVDLVLDKYKTEIAVLQCSSSIIKNFPIFSDDLFSKRKSKLRIYPTVMAYVPQNIGR